MQQIDDMRWGAAFPRREEEVQDEQTLTVFFIFFRRTLLKVISSEVWSVTKDTIDLGRSFCLSQVKAPDSLVFKC